MDIDTLREELCTGPLNLGLRRDTPWKFEILPVPAAVPTSHGMPCVFLFQARHALLVRTKDVMWKGRLIQVWHRKPKIGDPDVGDKGWTRFMTEDAAAFAHKNPALDLKVWPVLHRLVRMRHTRSYDMVTLPTPDVCQVPVFEVDVTTWTRAQNPTVQSMRDALAADAVRALAMTSNQTRNSLLVMAGLPQEDPK